MNYRRLVGMILSSALTLTMMAGCTSSSQEGQADAPQTSEGGGAEPVEVALLLTGYANDAGFCETCVDGLKKAGIQINRKMLSEMAIHDEAGFAALCETAKKAASK